MNYEILSTPYRTREILVYYMANRMWVTIDGTTILYDHLGHLIKKDAVAKDNETQIRNAAGRIERYNMDTLNLGSMLSNSSYILLDPVGERLRGMFRAFAKWHAPVENIEYIYLRMCRVYPEPKGDLDTWVEMCRLEPVLTSRIPPTLDKEMVVKKMIRKGRFPVREMDLNLLTEKQVAKVLRWDVDIMESIPLDLITAKVVHTALRIAPSFFHQLDGERRKRVKDVWAVLVMSEVRRMLAKERKVVALSSIHFLEPEDAEELTNLAAEELKEGVGLKSISGDSIRYSVGHPL